MSRETLSLLDSLLKQYQAYRGRAAELSLMGVVAGANHYRRLAVSKARRIREIAIYGARAVLG